MGNNYNPKSAAWQKAALSALCVVLALILVVMIFATVYINGLFGMINRVPSGFDPQGTNVVPPDDTDPDSTTSLIGTDITLSTLPVRPPHLVNREGIINVLLVGQDRRPGEPRQRSDSMILLSFNLNTNNITMISFLRDTYVSIPGYRDEKLNAAYAHGGFQSLNQTLAVNFGVHVDANVEVDFEGFTGIIDLLGGVDISLTGAEVRYLKDLGYTGLQEGVNHMDGKLALDYARIRYIDSDSARTGRQRTVIMALIEKYKNKGIGEMLTILEQLLPMITTDMTNEQIISYVWDLFPMLSSANIGSQQIPAMGTWQDMHIGDVYDAKLADMEINREILQGILENP